MTGITEKSLADLMDDALLLSWKLTYATILADGTFFEPRDFKVFSIEDGNMISSWADGLFQKYYHDRASGRCSIQDMVDFDIAKFDEMVQKDIIRMTELLKTVGSPKQLTQEDLKNKGYRGSWAGYSRAEDLQFHLSNAEHSLKHITTQHAEHKALPIKKQNFDKLYDLELSIRDWQEEINKLTIELQQIS